MKERLWMLGCAGLIAIGAVLYYVGALMAGSSR